MKHSRNMKETFPLTPSRNAIMGISTFNEALPVVDPNKSAGGGKSKNQGKSVDILITFTIRPHLPPCFQTIMPVPSQARTREVLDTVWSMFTAERERQGLLWGQIPSEYVGDYMLCFLDNEELKEAMKPPSRRPSGTAADGTIPSYAAFKSPLDADVGGAAPLRSGSVSASSKALHMSPPKSILQGTGDHQESPSLEKTLSNRRLPTFRQRSPSLGANANLSISPLDATIHYDDEDEDPERVVERSLRKTGIDACEEIPPNAYLSRYVKNNPGHQGKHDCSQVHLMLKPTFFASENVVFSESKTRKLIVQVQVESMDALLNHEALCRGLAIRAAERRELFAKERRQVEGRESHRRGLITNLEDTTMSHMMEEFWKRFRELEVGMIAQYRKITQLREEHEQEMRVRLEGLRKKPVGKDDLLASQIAPKTLME